MAAQGRGSAYRALAVAGLAIATLLLLSTGAAAKKAPTTYMVGDQAGWTKGLSSWWLAGKTFYAGDVLVFKYDKDHHDVAVVGGKGYQRCKVPRHSSVARVLNTGYDSVTLRRGNNYFICGMPGHCDAGMKLAVKAY